MRTKAHSQWDRDGAYLCIAWSDMRAAVVTAATAAATCETLNNNCVCGKLDLNLIVQNVAPDCRRRSPHRRRRSTYKISTSRPYITARTESHTHHTAAVLKQSDRV